MPLFAIPAGVINAWLPEVGPVDVYNTHYQAQEGYEKIRIYDNSVMADFVKQHDKGYPTFLLGDFNSAPDSPEYKDLMSRLPLRDAFAERNPGAPGFTIDPSVNTNVPKEEPTQRIDSLLWERFDLAMRRRDYFELPLQKLLGFARSAAFAEKATELTGYDVAATGTVIYNA